MRGEEVVAASFRKIAAVVAALAEDTDEERLRMLADLYDSSCGNVCPFVQADLAACGLVPVPKGREAEAEALLLQQVEGRA